MSGPRITSDDATVRATVDVAALRDCRDRTNAVLSRVGGRATVPDPAAEARSRFLVTADAGALHSLGGGTGACAPSPRCSYTPRERENRAYTLFATRVDASTRLIMLSPASRCRRPVLDPICDGRCRVDPFL